MQKCSIFFRGLNLETMSSPVQISTLSEDKRMVLKEFRNSVRDILKPEHDDKFLLRWLKARDFDAFKAEKMIRESFKWRKKFNIDEILSDKYVQPEVARKYSTSGFLGFDNEGSLIRGFRGQADYKGFVYSIRISGTVKWFCYLFESDLKKMIEHNEELGLNEDRITYIMDFNDFNIRMISDREVVNCGIHLLNTYQDNYPETLKIAYFVNVPTFFNWVFNIFKPFMNQVTLSKIKIFPVGCNTWKDDLLSTCDPKIIPACLGGLRVDPDGDPRCKTIMKIVTKIPISYYAKDDDKLTLRKDDPEVNFTVIRERSYFDYKVVIKEPDWKIKWEFQTKECNIRFGIFFKKLESNNTKQADLDELIAVENVECHVFPESGQLHCEKSGEYILHFDNTYSWFTSKQLFFKVQITKPDESDSKEV